ncbi:hypothetical protein CPB83DRAFT_890460 [Crepidotus variabilis]|uniref:FAD-binding PCMH-type domain-containing protein n=1 Tax=Crepidotus variabilis TaxID=179855 RepID=A0A9P6EPV8_9AGAR|nr:hypothetical protein CPB83DRAFT_890460 [Crepidotus variabilis]
MSSFIIATSFLVSGVLGQIGVSRLSPVDVASFNSSVNGRLYPGIPWAKPCFSLYNDRSSTPDQAACSVVQKNYFNAHIARSDAFGAYENLQFETCMKTGDQCMLDWMNAANAQAFTLPQQCKQGSVPPLYVDVQSDKDVTAAFAFAKKKNLMLTVKNTGHDFKGRSAGPDSLALWMHNLKSMKYNPKFTPGGCKNSQNAITYGAGVQFADLYAFANKNGVEIVGGADESVGAAGGFIQGGGHSITSPSLGLAADRVLEFKIVTPDGQLRTVNDCQNQDLFFALRGGGGGTFGVVMEVSILTTKPQPYITATITWPTDANNTNLRKATAAYVELATDLAKQKYGGYFTPTTGALFLMVPNLSKATVTKTLKPLADLTKSVGGNFSVDSVDNFWGYFNPYLQGKLAVTEDTVGLPVVMSSRLIPESNHRTAQGRKQLVDALMNSFANSIFTQLHITSPFSSSSASSISTPSSVNPVWRQSLYQIIWVNTWMYNSQLSDRQTAFATSSKAANYLRAITPDSGAYTNEGDVHEPDWSKSFWGSNYARLASIKQKYDPNQLLDCWQCVGWKGNNAPQYKCYI